jgi:Tol biopolymer transport system component
MSYQNNASSEEKVTRIRVLADGGLGDDNARISSNPSVGPRLKPTRTIRFTTDEGTYLSLNLSPEGKTIVFDLLGDIYTLAITGGKAKRITSGLAFDSQPSFSPDGKTILFVSDRNGQSNLWLMDSNGENQRALTDMEFEVFISPTWMPDGKAVLVSRIAENSSDPTIYTYSVDGALPQELVHSPTNSNHSVGPVVGSDARCVYYARGTKNTGGCQVEMHDIQTGAVKTLTNEPGGAFRPVASPDGTYLVYGTRRGADTWLKLRTLHTDEERWLTGPVQHDEQETTQSNQDVMPGSAFTPDSKALITSYGGKIWRVEVPSGQATMIPFTAEVEKQLGPLCHFEYPFDDTTLIVRSIRTVRLSPDGTRAAFSALDRIYVMDLPNAFIRWQ